MSADRPTGDDQRLTLHWFAETDECQECGYWANLDSVRRHHIEDALQADLTARADKDAAAIAEVWALADEWEATRCGVTSPGLRKAVDDLRAIGLAIKADNDAVDREDYAAFLAADSTPVRCSDDPYNCPACGTSADATMLDLLRGFEITSTTYETALAARADRDAVICGSTADCSTYREVWHRIASRKDAAAIAAVRAVLDMSCHHCGRMPEEDGDHTCLCPNSACFDHLADPVVSRTALRAALDVTPPTAEET